MRVVFMGTPEFAVPSLRALAKRHSVVGVFTQPDRRRGRGTKLQPTPVKRAADDLDIDVFQPESLRSPEVIEQLTDIRPDVICVAAFGQMLSPSVLQIPKHGCLNVHGSLLPRYRGAAPVHRAILDGDDVTGVSIMLMDEGLDTGPFSVVRTVTVDEKSVDELTDELALLGAEALIEALDRLDDSSLVWTSQDDSLATYAAKIAPSDVLLNPELTVSQALRRVRVSTRSARTKVKIGECMLDVLDAALDDTPLEPGAVLSTKHRLSLGFADGTIVFRRVRPEGRATMQGCDWARGARVEEARWESA